MLHVFHVVQQELQRILAMFCGTGHVHQAGRVQSGQLLEGTEQSQHALSAGLLLHPEAKGKITGDVQSGYSNLEHGHRSWYKEEQLVGSTTGGPQD